MRVKSIQIWDYVTSFFRGAINKLNLLSLIKTIQRLMKVKKYFLAGPNVVLTGGTYPGNKGCFELTGKKNQKKKIDDKELDKKEQEKETVQRGEKSKAVSLQKLYRGF